MEKDYKMSHRPGNPIIYPEEVATIDKITSGDYFPKDILNNYDKYFVLDNLEDEEQLINILKQSQNNPDLEVTFYRGAPSKGVLNTGDWITLSKEYAFKYGSGGEYADDPTSKVYKYTAKAKDISFDGDSIYEFGYWGEKQIGKEVIKELDEEIER